MEIKFHVFLEVNSSISKKHGLDFQENKEIDFQEYKPTQK